MPATTPREDLLRDALLEQEIERVASRMRHHMERITRGTADDEDRIAFRLYERILTALEGMA